MKFVAFLPSQHFTDTAPGLGWWHEFWPCPMPLLNPLNVPTVPLTFTRLSRAAATVDALGNLVLESATVTVQGVVTPLGMNRLGDLAPIVGVEGTGIPVKVRVAAWPSGVGAGAAVARLTYNGRPATIRLAPIREASAAAAKVAANLGVSAEGVLVFD